MPKISGYAAGGDIQAGDQFVVARAGANKSILGSGMYSIISDTILLASAANFDITGIPATYRSLKLIATLRSDRAAVYTDSVKLKINNDGGNNYFGFLEWGPPAAGSSEQVAAGGPYFVHYTCAASTPASWFSNLDILLPDYANTVTYKSWLSVGGSPNRNAAGQIFIYRGTGLWTSTAAINRITIYPTTGPNFITGSRCTLYGIP